MYSYIFPQIYQSENATRDTHPALLTGGALIHTKRTAQIASHALFSPLDPLSLKPKTAEVLVDRKYILAAMGLLSTEYPDVALRIMKKELVKDGVH